MTVPFTELLDKLRAQRYDIPSDRQRIVLTAQYSLAYVTSNPRGPELKYSDEGGYVYVAVRRPVLEVQYGYRTGSHWAVPPRLSPPPNKPYSEWLRQDASWIDEIPGVNGIRSVKFSIDRLDGMVDLFLDRLEFAKHPITAAQLRTGKRRSNP